MINNDKNNKVLSKYAEIVKSDSFPNPRFGHTVNLVSKSTVLVFGGAISTPGNYKMTSDLYLYQIQSNQWKKLETSAIGKTPHPRAAHASATVRENQLLFYGGSIGNGQYASDDLWFLDIKNNEDASWMPVPIEGQTPGPRYGHSMVYFLPILVLFGGSSSGNNSLQKNEIMSDVWVFATDKTPFKWIKLDIKNNIIPSARLYHSACIFMKYNGGNDAMILFGGRDSNNNSLKDLNILHRDEKEPNGNSYKYIWDTIQPENNDVIPIGRHQQSSAVFGPFLFVVGGRASNNTPTTFDVFSFISKRWFRFGTIGLFRHTIWTYFNALNSEKKELSLYIYGGFDSENYSQINSNLYKINIFNLFATNDILNKELNEHINNLIRRNNINNNNNKHNNENIHNKNHFELNSKVVVYNIPEENNLGTLIKEISYSKLTEVDKKILEKNSEGNKKKSEYDEEIVKEFLQLLPNPDEEFLPYKNTEQIIELNKDLITKLINDCKNFLMKSPTVITLRSPVKIFGNINGQYNDLMRYFSLFGRPSELRGDIESLDYLFLGNIVNRGAFSLETFCLLIALKVKYNANFHILRGSQEDIELCKLYGLAEECKDKLNENINDKNSIYKKICDLFDYLPLAAIINNQIICVHSGIGEHVKNISDINSIKKPYNVKDNIIVQEILWSSPNNNSNKEEYKGNNFTNNYRKYHFDEKMLNNFLTNNKLKMLIRSHDVIDSGIEKSFNDKCITVFSATNYCGTIQNTGALLFIKKSYEIQPKILTNEEFYSVWYKDWTKSEYPPSPKKIYKNK